jgi:hypothetical protein
MPHVGAHKNVIFVVIQLNEAGASPWMEKSPAIDSPAADTLLNAP